VAVATQLLQFAIEKWWQRSCRHCASAGAS